MKRNLEKNEYEQVDIIYIYIYIMSVYNVAADYKIIIIYNHRVGE